MQPRLEVLKAAPVAAAGGEGVGGFHLDGPVAGRRVEEGPLRIVGWVVGERAPVREVEVVAGQEVVGRTAVDISRPRVAEELAGVAGAEAAGFDLSLEAGGSGIGELLLVAVLDDGSRVDLAKIRVDVARAGVFSTVTG